MHTKILSYFILNVTFYVSEDLDEVTKCKCINGGTCQEESHKCKCPDEFTGNLCEISIQNICNIECQNGGTCIGNKCICFQGYTGHDCSSRKIVDFTLKLLKHTTQLL